MPVRKLVNPRRRRNVHVRRKRNAKGRFLSARFVKAKRKYRLRPRPNVKRSRRLKLKKRRSPGRPNPSLVLMGLNPVRQRSTMKKRRKKKNPRAGGHYKLRAHRKNPARHYHLRRRKNPFGLPNVEFIETAGFAIVGGVATRVIPQTLLPKYNQGLPGYGLNIVTVALLAWLAGKWRKAAGLGIGLGGTVMVAGRIIQDYFGKQLVTFGLIDTSTGAQTGATAVTTPASATQGLGQGDLAFDLRGYKATYFPLPSADSKGLPTNVPWAGDLAKLQALVQAGQRGAGAPVGKSVSATGTQRRSSRYAFTM